MWRCVLVGAQGLYGWLDGWDAPKGGGLAAMSEVHTEGNALW